MQVSIVALTQDHPNHAAVNKSRNSYKNSLMCALNFSWRGSIIWIGAAIEKAPFRQSSVHFSV